MIRNNIIKNSNFKHKFSAIGNLTKRHFEAIYQFVVV